MMNSYEKAYLKQLMISRTKDLGEIMCKTLEDLQGLSAHKILERTGQEEAAPVDLDKIIDYLHIRIFPTTFDDIQQDGKKVSGLVLLNNNEVGIFYNKNDSIEMKRVVISHELGHCCFHGDSLKNGYIECLSDDGTENEHEEIATIFALRLLIPERSLKNVIAKLLLPSVTALSQIFQVPKNFMIKRMKDLNLAYYLDDEDKLVKPRYE